MTAARTEHGGNTLLAIMMTVVAVADVLVAGLGARAWRGYRHGTFTAEQAGAFAVMGLSAVVGVVLTLLAMIALLRGVRGHRLARGTVNLTWLRLGAVVIALALVALVVGVSAAAVFGMVLAVGDALGGFVVTGAAARRTRSD